MTYTYLGQGNFARYVKPQLQSLMTEYNSLFLALNETLADFKPAMEMYRNSTPVLDKLSASCPSINSKACLDLLEQLNEYYKNQLALVDSLKFVPTHKGELDQFVNGLDLLAKYRLALVNTYLQIDSSITEYLIKGSLGLTNTEVANWTDNLNFSLHMFLLSQCDQRYENIFSAFWLDFIRPVQQSVLPHNNLKFFRNRLTELNIRWNELHSSLTKKNIKVSSQANSIMAIMDSRWNSILKVSLKPLQ